MVSSAPSFQGLWALPLVANCCHCCACGPAGLLPALHLPVRSAAQQAHSTALQQSAYKEGPLSCQLALPCRLAIALHALAAQHLSVVLPCCTAGSPTLPACSLPCRLAIALLLQALCSAVSIEKFWLSNLRTAHAGTLPRKRDLLPITGLGICLYLNQLFFILGIDLSGVVVAACMQPTVPVFTALIAVMLKLEAGSMQKACGIALAVAGSISMVSVGKE